MSARTRKPRKHVRVLIALSPEELDLVNEARRLYQSGHRIGSLSSFIRRAALASCERYQTAAPVPTRTKDAP